MNTRWLQMLLWLIFFNFLKGNCAEIKRLNKKHALDWELILQNIHICWNTYMKVHKVIHSVGTLFLIHSISNVPGNVNCLSSNSFVCNFTSLLFCFQSPMVWHRLQCQKRLSCCGTRQIHIRPPSLPGTTMLCWQVHVKLNYTCNLFPI